MYISQNALVFLSWQQNCVQLSVLYYVHTNADKVRDEKKTAETQPCVCTPIQPECHCSLLQHHKHWWDYAKNHFTLCSFHHTLSAFALSHIHLHPDNVLIFSTVRAKSLEIPCLFHGLFPTENKKETQWFNYSKHLKLDIKWIFKQI